MKKTNKELRCDSCGLYFETLTRHESGNKYCGACSFVGIRFKEIKKQVKSEEVDKMVEALFKTPPPPKKSRRERRHK